MRMRYLIQHIPAIVLLFCLPALASGQISKEEKKFWAEKAKMYKKNPIALKAEFDNYQEQIKDLKKRNKEMQSQISEGGGSELVDSLRWALIQMEGEMQSLRKRNEQLLAEYKSQKTVISEGITTGLVYRVQIGAYVFHEMKAAPVDGNDFVAERADGFNKYMIGMFRTYEECDDFKRELVTLGIENPWIVPYIDGVRVTIDEANTYLREQGSTANFMNN